MRRRDFSTVPHEILDIPVQDLPFKAGNGFFATVSEDGIAHIVVTTVVEGNEQPKKSLGQWARDTKGVFKGAEKHAKDDTILESILDKHAPESLG